MRARTEPRPAPPRSYAVPIPGREDHVFTSLRDDRMAALLALASRAGGGDPNPEVADPNLAAMAGVVGILWAHPSMDLEEAPPSPAGLTPAALVAYGDRVLDDLDAAGYVLGVDVTALYLTIAQQIRDRNRDRYKAFDEEGIRDRVGFFLELQKAGSAS